jgi:divinyl protochlorophyllide a 8-vinyl-reductase
VIAASQPARPSGGADPVSRIGPNAILQTMAVLRATFGEAGCAALMQRAGLQAHVADPPQQMVDERDVVALHRMLRAELGVPRARALSHAAGLATGDYLLAHRIPRPARLLLPRLPAAWASRALLAAIRGHAWTFCGSGLFSVQHATRRQPLRLTIAGCATSRGALSDEPLCDYYAATFERLFGVLVHPRTVVREVACAAMGAPDCVFEVDWSGTAR